MVMYVWDTILYFGFFLAACIVASVIYCLLAEARNAAKDGALPTTRETPKVLSTVAYSRRISWL